MDNQARMILGNLLQQRGAELVTNAALMEGLLIISMGSRRRELNVLLGSLHEEIPAELARMPARLNGDAIRRLARRLEENLSLRPEAAQWAVESWALALGKRMDSPARARKLGFSLPSTAEARFLREQTAGRARSSERGQTTLPRPRQLKSRHAIEVRRRAKNSPQARWQHWGRTPGTVPLPEGYDYSFEKMAASDEHLQKIAVDLKDAAPIAALNLHSGHYSDAGLVAFLEHPFLAGLRELYLEGTRSTTDRVLEAVGRLFPELALLNPGTRCFITDDGLRNLSPLACLQSLDLSYCSKITNDGLVHLRALQSLRTLHLSSNWEINDGGMEHLLALPGLRSLHLSDCRITDAGLETLGRFPALQYLELSHNRRITGAGLVHLCALTGLVGLDLMGCSEVNDEGLLSLGEISALERLHLSWMKTITDDGLVAIGRLRGLKSLSLRECPNISDNGLRHLSRLGSLTRLDLAGCDRLTDDGIVHLRALANLEELKISGHITDRGLVPLIRSLPKLRDLWVLGEHQVSRAGEAQIRRPGLDMWIPRNAASK